MKAESSEIEELKVFSPAPSRSHNDMPDANSKGPAKRSGRESNSTNRDFFMAGV